MTYDELMKVLEPLDGSMEVFIASTVLMPLDEIYSTDELMFFEINLVQSKRDYQPDNCLVNVQELREFLDDYNDNDSIVIMSSYPRPLENAEVKTVGDMKKTGSNRSVSVREAWDSHPVHENTVREALILYTPL